VASADLFDPVTAAGRPIADMRYARAGARSITLDNGNVLLIGGRTGEQAVPVTEVFNQKEEKFERSASLGTPRYNHAVTQLPSGAVLVTGGRSGQGVIASAEIVDNVASAFRAITPMRRPREGHVSTLLANGKVLIIGGTDGTSAVDELEIFDPVTEQF